MTAEVSDGTVVKRRPTVRIRNFRGTLLVARLEHSLELVDSAAFIFRSIDGKRSIKAIGDLLAARFEIPIDEAVNDVKEVVTDLIDYRIVECLTP